MLGVSVILAVRTFRETANVLTSCDVAGTAKKGQQNKIVDPMLFHWRPSTCDVQPAI